MSIDYLYYAWILWGDKVLFLRAFPGRVENSISITGYNYSPLIDSGSFLSIW